MKDSKVIIILIILICFGFQPGVPRLFAQEKNEEQSQDRSAVEQPNAQGGAQVQEKTAKQSPQPGDEVKKNLTPAVSVMEIKRLESEAPLYSIELRDVQLNDFFRVIAHDYDLNIIVDKDVSGAITASFTNISLEEALDGIAELSNLTIQKKGNIFRVAPNLITKTVLLKYTEAKKILQGASASGTGAAAGTSAASAGTAPDAGGASAASSAVQSTIYDLLSPQGKLFLGEKANSVIVIDYPTNVKKIEDYLNSVDQKMASRVFKLKFLKSTDVVGQPVAPSGSAAGSTSTTTTSSSGGGQ